MTLNIKLPTPKLQIDFSFSLGQARTIFLQDALLKTLEGLDIGTLDRELLQYAGRTSLRDLARHGLRGELGFAVPCVLEANPYLLGYYRLLLGFSKKEFYTKSFGVSQFASMEEKGVLTEPNRSSLSELCSGLASCFRELIDGVGIDRIGRDILDDLTLLTLGPQLRGGANVKKGADAIIDVFQVIHETVEHAASSSTPSRIEIENAAGRRVTIEFAADPDIVIREELTTVSIRNIIAIEVKGGRDFSNIHNRLGEAEKSHQKAKTAGYVECWTVVNVDRVDLSMAARESPSTNRFYKLSDLISREGDEFQDFRRRIVAATGIAEKL